MPEQKYDLDFGSDGVIRSIYEDKLNDFAKDIGGDLAKVCRLSNVEWEEIGERKGWSVRAAHDTQLAIRTVDTHAHNRGHHTVVSKDEELPIHLFISREEAVRVEVAHYDELMPPKETP